MRKIFLPLILLVAAAQHSSAQSYVGSAEYNKTSQQALVLQLPYKEEVAEGTILQKLRETGYDPESKGKLFWKKNTLDGYYVFKGVTLQGASTPVDLYFKVEPRKREKDQSTIHLLVSRGDENFIPASDTATFAAAQRFLNNFVAETGAYKLTLDIQAQEEAVRNAEKKLAKLQDDERDMKKKIENLENDLRKNRSEQEEQQRKIEEERRKLSGLRTKGTTR